MSSGPVIPAKAGIQKSTNELDARVRGHDEYDVVVVGGGLVGASLAIALAPSGKRIALIEAAALPKSAKSWDERCIAINVASRRIYQHLGVWDALNAEAVPILATHISERGRFGVSRFTAEEAGEEALGWNIPVRAVGAILWERASALPNVTVMCPAKVEALRHPRESGDPECIALTLDPRFRGGDVTAKLVVACDGAQSAIRTFLGIGAHTDDYEQTAIVSAVRPERAHNGVAYERFVPDGPIAVLPKPGQDCGLVWTVPTSKAETMLAWSDAEFLAQLQDGFGHRLGKLLEVGKRIAFPLTRVMSDELTAERVIFAGNAAQALHPIAAQGFNLGLRDVATVAELAGPATDPGNAELLREYERRRRGERETVAGFTDRLVRIFSNSIPGLSGARHWGLLALDLMPAVKQAVMRQNLGFAGDTPELARRQLS